MPAANGVVAKPTHRGGLTVKVPSKAMCRRILEVAKVPTASIAHAEMVKEVASAIARTLLTRFPNQIDARLVTAGAMVHELGTSREKGLRYIMVGVGLAHRLGLDPRLIEVIRRHKGAALGYREAAQIGLPYSDLMPRTIEELIVSHADLMLLGDQRKTIPEVASKFRRAGLTEVANRIVENHRRLSEAASVDIDTLGPTNEMTYGSGEDLIRGFTKDPGRLLVVEDETSLDRKRTHYNSWTYRTTAKFFGYMLLGFLIMAFGTELNSLAGDTISLIGLMIFFVIPFGYLRVTAGLESRNYHLGGPQKVYENGLAYQKTMDSYTFRPGSYYESYSFEDVKGLGTVLTVGNSFTNLDFLETMTEYNIVKAVVSRKLLELDPHSEISFWRIWFPLGRYTPSFDS